MAITNHDRVGKGLEHLRAGLGPFIEREMRTLPTGEARALVTRLAADDRYLTDKPVAQWDVAALLKLMWDAWNDVFRQTLGHAERSLVSELREFRNKWAHQEPFSSTDAYRALDSCTRLLAAVSAAEAAAVERIRTELLRVQFDEETRSRRRRTGNTTLTSGATASLKPWREVITPHQDVASGQYQTAEFAADLWQVHLGEGPSEYQDPTEFFRRTYLTASLRQLLVGAVRRLSGQGGDPVIQLQTNFGGGKTHSMLALFHLFSGHPPTQLPGVDDVLGEAGIEGVPETRRAVLVGNKISAGNPIVKPDGTVIHTLWGEIAYQLGGQAAYAQIAADDQRATNPGDRLRQLFSDYSPCLILIDEWVAYARQLHEESDLPGGSFDTQFTFAQALTEAAKGVKNCLLVVSLPASDRIDSPHAQADDQEVGGYRGREALERLHNVVGRIEASWRPATAEESFEIVRRRLFQPFTEQRQFQDRDLIAQAFADLYITQSQEFPLGCNETDYKRRIAAAYPIHPEIFDRLYSDWSTLIKFQRTRGVLRLMAAVIHHLWARGDRDPLIVPAHIALDDRRIQLELTRNLSDHWVPIIEKDVDGPESLPLQIDAAITNLGKFSASRRVARTIFLGSAPTITSANRGIEDRRIKLGCVMPGESPAVFGDALRRLAADSTYLYQDGVRYWYSTRPTVIKLAEDRAEQLHYNRDRVEHELAQRLRNSLRERGDFSRVHPLPQSSADVPDDVDARLVVLGSSAPYSREEQNAATVVAANILEYRGNIPRIFRNALVFLAADKTRLQELHESIRRYLAWKSILDDQETLNLDPQQVKQATNQYNAADLAVAARLPETYQWLLIPEQATPQAEIEWQSIRLQGSDPLAVRAGNRLIKEELLITTFAPSRLRLELDRVPLWRGDHVSIQQLTEDFARYPYLPRLQGSQVLVNAVRNGAALLTWTLDSFAYADSFDPAAGRYQGLQAGCSIQMSISKDTGLVVKPGRAEAQLKAEREAAATVTAEPPQTSHNGGSNYAPADQGQAAVQFTPTSPPPATQPPPAPKPRRFYGAVALDPAKPGSDAGRIGEEIIAHLVALLGARVKVTLEIEAEIPDGAPEHVVRTVSENSYSLKFTDFGFEED